MLEGTVRVVRSAAGEVGRSDLPVAGMAKLESALYGLHRHAVGAIPIRERAVPLLPADDAEASRLRVLRDVADGADAVVVKPGGPALDIVAKLAGSADRPLISYYTPDERAFLVAASEGLADPLVAEREFVSASRRAGADLVITHGAFALASS
jgi:porphobilinogen synthase